MTEKLLFTCTHAGDDPERAILPFLAANIAAIAGQEAVVLCTTDAVWLGTRGGTDGISYEGLPVLADLYEELVGNGGKVWLCAACTKPRGIEESVLASGAEIIGAASVVEEIVKGATPVTFA